MTRDSCLEALEKNRRRMPPSAYEELKRACSKDDYSDYPNFIMPNKGNELAELGVIGLGGAGIAAGAAVTITAAVVLGLGFMSNANQ